MLPPEPCYETPHSHPFLGRLKFASHGPHRAYITQQQARTTISSYIQQNAKHSYTRGRPSISRHSQRVIYESIPISASKSYSQEFVYPAPGVYIPRGTHPTFQELPITHHHHHHHMQSHHSYTKAFKSNRMTYSTTFFSASASFPRPFFRRGQTKNGLISGIDIIRQHGMFNLSALNYPPKVIAMRGSRGHSPVKSPRYILTTSCYPEIPKDANLLLDRIEADIIDCIQIAFFQPENIDAEVTNELEDVALERRCLAILTKSAVTGHVWFHVFKVLEVGETSQVLFNRFLNPLCKIWIRNPLLLELSVPSVDNAFLVMHSANDTGRLHGLITRACASQCIQPEEVKEDLIKMLSRKINEGHDLPSAAPSARGPFTLPSSPREDNDSRERNGDWKKSLVSDLDLEEGNGDWKGLVSELDLEVGNGDWKGLVSDLDLEEGSGDRKGLASNLHLEEGDGDWKVLASELDLEEGSGDRRGLVSVSDLDLEEGNGDWKGLASDLDREEGSGDRKGLVSVSDLDLEEGNGDWKGLVSDLDNHWKSHDAIPQTINPGAGGDTAVTSPDNKTYFDETLPHPLSDTTDTDYDEFSEPSVDTTDTYDYETLYPPQEEEEREIVLGEEIVSFEGIEMTLDSSEGLKFGPADSDGYKSLGKGDLKFFSTEAGAIEVVFFSKDAKDFSHFVLKWASPTLREDNPRVVMWKGAASFGKPNEKNPVIGYYAGEYDANNPPECLNIPTFRKFCVSFDTKEEAEKLCTVLQKGVEMISSQEQIESYVAWYMETRCVKGLYTSNKESEAGNSSSFSSLDEDEDGSESTS